MRSRRFLPVLMAIVVVALAACGSSSKSGSSTNTTAGNSTGTTAPQSTELGTGVTANSVKIGVSFINFDCIKQFTDTIRENQQDYYQAFINDINAKGGVAGGKKITAVYRSICPIQAEQGQASCTQFSEDDKVFMVIGNVYDPSGNLQSCLAKQHKTPVITFELTQAIMDKSPPGMIILPGNNPERIDSTLAKLMTENKTIDGKKVAILGSVANRKSVTDGVEPALKSIPNTTMGTTALLAIGSTGDTTAAQSQLDSFIEKWKSEGVNAIWLTSDEATSKQFVEKIKKQMPDVQLITDATTARQYGREEKASGANPNPYDGIISTSGPLPSEYATSENWKYCADIYKAQTGKTAPGPTDVVKTPDGKTLDTYGGINDACQILSLIKQIFDRNGQYLNVTNYVNTVDNYGTIVNRGGGQYASLHTGKYDIDDTFRLVAFDSTINPGGDWKALTALENVP